ncbi:MAG: TetR/AcrR family transcriptional regulator [Halanaerobiales bacterium]
MKVDTRRTIMKTAVNLFAEQGFKDTSISNIAKEADVGKGTIYWHFDSKEDLFFSIIEEKGKIYFDKVLQLDRSDLSPEKIIYQYIKGRIEFIDKNYKLAEMLINNNDVINREFKEMMEKKHRQSVAVLEKAIQRGIDGGKFREGPSNEIALMIINATNSAHNNFSCSLEGNTEERTKKIFDFIMNGLAGGKSNDK